MTTHAHLKEKFPALDHSLKRRSVFCAKEKGACYRLEHLGEFESVDYQVDGVLISGDIEGQSKCDRLLLVKISEGQWIHVFIELKGTDVSHGLEQLEATLAHPLFTPRAQGEKRLARLVAKSVPSSKNNPLIERVRKNLLQRYRCSLRILKPNQPEDFEDLRRSS